MLSISFSSVRGTMVKLEAACFLTSVLVLVAINLTCVLSAVRVSSVLSSPSPRYLTLSRHSAFEWLLCLWGKLFLFNLNLFYSSCSLMSPNLSHAVPGLLCYLLRVIGLALQKH